MTPELIILTAICAGLALYASWSLGRQRMASTLAIVRKQNEDLLCRIAQLERDRDHDRQLIDVLRTENDALRLRQSELEKQIASLENSLRLTSQEKVFWQAYADKAKE